MDRAWRNIGLVLMIVILAGGLLVAFLSGSSRAGMEASPGALVGGSPASNPTVQLSNGLNNVAASASGLVSASHQFGLSSSGLGAGPDQTLVLSGNDQSQSSSVVAQPRQTLANVSRSVEFFSNATLRVASPSASLDQASGIAYSVGGYVAYSTVGNSTAFAVLRVPSQSYQGVLSRVESLGVVVGAVSTSNDVTVKYTDLNATLASLTAERTSLLKLINQSNSINSTLQVEAILQEVNAHVNEVQSEILQTQRLVDYGTISITLEKLTPSAKPLTLRITATPRSGLSPLSVTFNAVVEGGSGQYIVNYNFGDGTSSQGQALIHTFEQPGDYNVTVTATDSSGGASEAWTIVKVASPPISSGLGNFSSFVGGLFIQVIEGVVEVAVVVLPLAGVAVLIMLPFRRRLASHNKQEQLGSAPPPEK